MRAKFTRAGKGVWFTDEVKSAPHRRGLYAAGFTVPQIINNIREWIKG